MKKLIFALCGILLGATVPAQAQFELKGGSFNNTFVPQNAAGAAATPSGPAVVANPPPTPGQTAAVFSLSGSAGPRNVNGVAGNPLQPTNAAGTMVLAKASIGSGFAAGVPRYAFGDEILPPTTNFDGTLAVDSDYWRPQPVFPGEIIPGISQPPVPIGTVNVLSASINSTTVTVASVPPGLVVGATLLGEPITRVLGLTVTLAGNAATTVTGNTAFPITPASSFYYSPHAQKVFAHQPGRVEIKWVTRVPDGGLYRVKEEIFAVSSNTNRPIRTIFWTEGTFDGPKVRISDGRITTVSPAHNLQVPKAVADEVSIPGYNPVTPNLNTLSFEKFNGVGELHAYNVEGRLLIEYLGNIKGSDGSYEFIGSEILELKRTAPVGYPAVALGKEILPGNGRTDQIPSPVLGSQQNGASYYGSTVRPDQTLSYFAERETSPANDPDNGSPQSPNEAYNKVVFYWLERSDFNINWPTHQDRYWLRWSPDLNDYAHYTVDPGGSTPATGISFTGGVLPQLVYQDDSAQTEAKLDSNTQRFYAATGADQRNRALLKFSADGGTWYINIYTQAENRAALRTGGGPTAGLAGRSWDGQWGTDKLAPLSNILALSPNASFNQTALFSYNNNITGTVPGPTPGGYFTIVWQGWFDVSREGAGFYTFGTTSDDASVVYFDLNDDGDFADPGELVLNNNFIQAATTRTGTVSLPNARRVRIAIGYMEVTGSEVLEVRWKKGSGLSYASLNQLNPLSGHFSSEAPSAIIPVDTSAGLEVGMVVAGSDVPAGTTITRILENNRVELSQAISGTQRNLTFTVQSDMAAEVATTATVGTRIEPPAGHEKAAYISGGTGYYPAGYLNPFVSGVAAANLGAVIPVNALPGNNLLTLRWFKKVSAPGTAFQDFYVPGKVGRYTVSFPATTVPEIVIAQGVGTDDLPPAESTGSVYVQNNPGAPGFNPNEEHAFMLGGRAYALRDDLNTPTTSQPCVLLAYTDPVDSRPAMHAYKVSRTSSAYNFDYISTAGTLLVKPYPLPLMPLPLVPTGVGSAVRSKDLEIIGADAPVNTAVIGDSAYDSFTFQDRKGFTWIHRGPHNPLPVEPTGGKVFTGGDAGEGLDLDGVFTYAFNVGTNAAPGQARDANFTADTAPGITVIAPNQIPNWHNPEYGSSAADNVVENVMRSIRWAAAPATVQVNLGNIVQGRRYKLQLLFAETSTSRGFDINLEGQTVADEFYPGNIQGNTSARGTVFSHEFIGGDNTLNIVLNGVTTSAADQNPILCGVTLEQLPAQPTLTMKLYYQSREGFFIPGMATQPPAGTILPFLRQPGRTGQPLNLAAIENNQADEPLPIIYRPAWPAQAPELRVGETLALPKFGLPQVRGQVSAQLLYQQSMARDSTNSLTKTSVTLHDPTREKTIALDAAGVALTAIPSSIATTSHRGKTYFQRLAPHLQQRIFVDPLRGAKGTLILVGTFHDEIAGEDYLDLNLLSEADEAALKALATDSDPNKSKWNAAIEALTTRVETFMENPALAGTYIADPSRNQDVGENELAKINHPDTAVDSYAVTATGQGTGFVTMVFGNGRHKTPEGDPVQIKVFKVAPQLYVGDLKVIASANPLDEQVTLRHSGDFAGRPEDYDYEWKWTTGAASAPAVYTTTMSTRLGNAAGGTHLWKVMPNPGTWVSPAYQNAAVALPRSINVHPADYTAEDKAADLPTVLLKAESPVDFTGGVPGDIVFSTTMGTLDGFVLYVNGNAALASNAPAPRFSLTNAATGLSNLGLLRQYRVPSSYFTAGPNSIEVALYTAADPGVLSTIDFRLDAATETDAVLTGPVWQTPSDPTGKNTNSAIVGGNPLNPFGGSTFVLNDRWFTMRYKPKAGTGNVLGSTTWSRWMPPQFVEGWVKRVLAGINPFEQRVKDLFNNGINTDISVLTQAGKRWEGDIALTLGNIQDVGLIEIYETVLNRAKAMSIDANTNDPDTNNALILAAGYLNDLYTLLGHEAYADAANPTISIDDEGSAATVNTSRFSFEGQVASSLDEELGLLRGRNDFVSPGVGTAPFYNRLFWNYTRGINSGEAIYALNYNIKEKVGSSTANGVIDESDAQRMFPQGHGDAYGHYLTALTGYYKLLTNANFTWTPRAEAVTVLGQPVTVDYFDERKFAAAAGNVARTAQQVLALTWRQTYKDDPAAGWSQFRDSTPVNSQTNVKSRQGFDEWASRSTQGALYHWAVANAMLPVVDAVHTGIQKIDRTTVPEIPELASMASSFQTTMDSANARLNPLGLSSGAIAFDIAPAKILIDILEGGGASHYQQIAERSLTALNNAAGAFNQAATMTGALRNQENSLDEFNTTIVEQERAYRNELIDIYGRPYSGEIGAGKLYNQGYEGPDLFHWFIIDRPNDLVNTSLPVTINIKQATGFAAFTGNTISDLVTGLDAAAGTATLVNRTVRIDPNRFAQYNDVWREGGLGSRAETGELQSALLDAQQTLLALSEFNTNYQKENANLRQSINSFNDLVTLHAAQLKEQSDFNQANLSLSRVILALNLTSEVLDAAADASNSLGETVAEFFPTAVGLANDPSSAARGGARTVGIVAAAIFNGLAIASRAGAGATELSILNKEQELEQTLTRLGFSFEEKQAAAEFASAYRDFVSHSHELMQLTLDHQQAQQNVSNVIAKGNRLLAEREIFRQRAAAIIQGYRTRDVTFRLFRNEALEQYRSLFDLASRYTYLAAKSYDYETGLLGTPAGQALFQKIVASRALGDLTDGTPQLTTSNLGDSGLAGSVARLNADYAVANGRLGINNPDQNGTVFSLRTELFRIMKSDEVTSDEEAWRQTLEQHIKANILNDSDVASQCRNLKKPDGTPVPGLIIPFSSSILHGRNFFGLETAAGDHNFTHSNFATRIFSVGIALPGYVGMDTYAAGEFGSGAPASGAPNALNATPYLYLIPCGMDFMLAPPLGDTNTLRAWKVEDQALPLPFNLGANDFNAIQFFNANGTLSEKPWITRKHQAFRPVEDPSFFYGNAPSEFTNTRLIGRSVWNSQWKIVIPAYSLLANEQEGLNRFTASVNDILLFLKTYSNSGN